MIGVARCSSSRPMPTPGGMSGSARTTTEGGAAVTRTASVARTTTGSPGRPPVPGEDSAGGRCGDVDIGAEVAQLEGEGGVLAGFVEGAGEHGPPQLTGLLHDRERGVDG